MVEQIEQNWDWCNCGGIGNPKQPEYYTKEGLLFCKTCDMPVCCEFTLLDVPSGCNDETPYEHQAEVYFCTYTVCNRHLKNAEDNVSGW